MKKKIILKESIDILNSLPDMGTQEYSYHVQELIDNLKSVKSTLKSGPDRRNYRKESGNLQRAIEALRYLNRRNQRMLKTEHSDISNMLHEYVDYVVGITGTVPRCNLKKTLQNVTDMSAKTASNIDTLFGGFVPYYLCDAAEGLTDEFGDVLINPIKEYKKMIDEAIDIGLSGINKEKYGEVKRSIVLNSKFTSASAADKILKKAYKNEQGRYDSFNLSSFLSNFMNPKLRDHEKISAMTSDIQKDLREKTTAILSDTGSDRASTNNMTIASYYQTFARGAINYIIKIVNEDYGSSLSLIKD